MMRRRGEGDGRVTILNDCNQLTLAHRSHISNYGPDPEDPEPEVRAQFEALCLIYVRRLFNNHFKSRGFCLDPRNATLLVKQVKRESGRLGKGTPESLKRALRQEKSRKRKRKTSPREKDADDRLSVMR